MCDKVHVDLMVITRKKTEKICRYAFEYAKHRAGRPADYEKVVTCVDKSNKFKAMSF